MGRDGVRPSKWSRARESVAGDHRLTAAATVGISQQSQTLHGRGYLTFFMFLLSKFGLSPPSC